jgi:hypothetical protein
VNRRLGFLLLRAGGLKGDGADCHIARPSPLARRYLRGKTCYVLTNGIAFVDVTNRRRG